jgi:glycosyltransferase involved in cell wall biosynthesis
MKLLILSWRDIKHPQTGGAGVVIHELSKRWVKWGHEVTVFTSRFPGSSPRENVDGVEIIRSGNPISLYLHANRHYKKQFRGKFDVIIEELNGPIPWYSYYYTQEPIIGLIHQTGRYFDEFRFENSVAYYEMPPIINIGEYLLEPHILKYFRNFPILVMSESTREDFLDLKCSPDMVHVIPEGTKVKPIDKILKKNKDPAFIYLGRLNRSKRIDHVLQAIGQVKKQFPNIRLHIIGRGKKDYENELKLLAKDLGIGENTTFHGYLSEETKNKIIQMSHALLITSIKEGWGLVVTEANAMGTPAIGYNVSGLKDSIRHGITGILVDSGDINALSEAVVKLLRDRKLREKLNYNAWMWSKEFTWDRSAKAALKKIKNILRDYYNKNID